MPCTEGCWSTTRTTSTRILPVGKSEPGELITATVVRELYEQTGLTVKPESLKVAHIIHGAWGVEAPNGFLTVRGVPRGVPRLSEALQRRSGVHHGRRCR